MPSNFTENYQLSQWEAGDKVQRVDFNADNAKIDGALTQKAERTALDSLAQVVNGHTAMLSLKGNCQIWTFTYIGTGTCGMDHPTTITFPKRPLLAVISSETRLMWLPPQDGWFYLSDTVMNHFSWSGNTASWYAETYGVDPGNAASQQLNTKDKSYRVVALFAVD